MEIDYTGNWISLKELELKEEELEEGDLVMFETLSGVEVVEIEHIDDEGLKDYNKIYIPKDQILAVKKLCRNL